jgi:Phage capsid protein
MANETYDNVLAIAFSDMMHVRAQQMRARTRFLAEYRDFGRADQIAYDSIGTVEAVELQGRNNQSQPSDIALNRRLIQRRHFSITLFIDDYDLKGSLLEPHGQYASACVRAMERQFDIVFIQSAVADAFTGRTFTVDVPFATDGGLTVNATTGLTLAKLLNIQQNFNDAEVGIDIPQRIGLFIAGDERTTMLQIDQLVNTRYTSQLRLDQNGGQLRSVMDMDVVMFGANTANPALSVSGGVRTCLAVSEKGVCMGLQNEWGITVKDRPDFVNVSQVQIVGTLGGVRTEGVRVQQVTTTTF